MAVPETQEEIAAEEALDGKLAAFFEAEMADTPVPGPANDEPQDDPVEAVVEPEAVAEVEPEVEETPEPEASEPELLAGKYRTPEELAAAYKELESRLGSQGHELGELRKQLEESLDERFSRFEQSQLAVTAPVRIQEALDEGRYYEAANEALQSRNAALYTAVMNSWAESEPFNAYAYDQELRQRDTIAAVDERLSRVGDPADQFSADQAMREFAADKPDLGVVVPEMLKVAEESPRVLALLQDPDPATRVEVLDYLYTKARGRQGETLAAAKQQADAETQAAAREAKTQATVGTPVTSSQAKPKTAQDDWRDEFRKVLFDESTSIRSGLTSD